MTPDLRYPWSKCEMKSLHLLLLVCSCWAASMQSIDEQQPSNEIKIAPGPFETTLPKDFNYASVLNRKVDFEVRVSWEALKKERLDVLNKMGRGESLDAAFKQGVYKWSMPHAPIIEQIETSLFFHQTPYHVVNNPKWIPKDIGLSVDPETRILHLNGLAVQKDFVVIVALKGDLEAKKEELLRMEQEYKESLRKDSSKQIEEIAVVDENSSSTEKAHLLNDNDVVMEEVQQPLNHVNVEGIRQAITTVAMDEAIAAAKSDAERMEAIRAFANKDDLRVFLVEKSLLELYSEMMRAQLNFPGAQDRRLLYTRDICAHQWHVVLSYMVYAHHTRDLLDPPEFYEIPLGTLAMLTVQASSHLGIRDPENISRHRDEL